MKIRRIHIKNYKSIKEIDLLCSPKLNVFIGENSVGKSNIFDAINWPLGPTYPSFNSTNPQDHFMGDPENKISISLYFDDDRILQLSECWEDYKHQVKSGLNLSGGYITDNERQRYCCGYLDVNRSILDYLPSNKWSLLGRILQEINTQFKQEEFADPETGEVIKKTDLLKNELARIRDDILFSVRDDHGNEIMKQFIHTLQRESARQLNKDESDFIIDLNLYDPWNFYRSLQLLVREPDLGLSFQASSLGMGIQASISIAVLKAYSMIKLRNSTPLFIDEPELFLHPQAQRSFYRTLLELAENGTQIFYTTHSPDFLSVGRFNEIHLTRKHPTEGTYVRNDNLSHFITDLNVRTGIKSTEDDLLLQYKNAYDETGDTQKANEVIIPD